MIAEPDYDDVIERIDPKYRPIWRNRPRREQIALARYYLPLRSRKAQIIPSRPKIAKLYCPFACQTHFPSGHRYCINTFTGCSHACVYCYAASYSPEVARAKPDYYKGLRKDMQDLEAFDVPSAPVHLSNSTDPFQPLEKRTRSARFALEQILEHRHRFDTVTLLTKNPLFAASRGYVELLQQLRSLPAHHPKRVFLGNRPAVRVQVSVAFWREEARAAYDPGAPATEQRVEGILALREAGIPVVLRVDPLFPRSPLPAGRGRVGNYGLIEAQTLNDLDQLLQLAVRASVSHVVYSAAKITQPRGRGLCPTMRRWRDVYRAIAHPDKLDWHGGSWRLPRALVEEHVTAPFVELCQQHGLEARFCMQDLLLSNEPNR